MTEQKIAPGRGGVWRYWTARIQSTLRHIGSAAISMVVMEALAVSLHGRWMPR